MEILNRSSLINPSSINLDHAHTINLVENHDYTSIVSVQINFDHQSSFINYKYFHQSLHAWTN
jgi:hypothetical protein